MIPLFTSLSLCIGYDCVYAAIRMLLFKLKSTIKRTHYIIINHIYEKKMRFFLHRLAFALTFHLQATMDVTRFGCPKDCHKKCESMYPIVRLSQTEALFSLAQQSSTFADGKHYENIQMNPECSQWFQQAFDSLFSRWTALKLAVEHSNDTRKGLQVNKMQCDHINKSKSPESPVIIRFIFFVDSHRNQELAL